MNDAQKSMFDLLTRLIDMQWYEIKRLNRLQRFALAQDSSAITDYPRLIVYHESKITEFHESRGKLDYD